MENLTEQLRAEVEATAKVLGLKPSTVGQRAGQGGRFYSRLKDGKRVWPETYETVMARLHEMRSFAACDTSHGDVSERDKGAN